MKYLQLKRFPQIWVRSESIIQMWKAVNHLLFWTRDVCSKESEWCLRGRGPHVAGTHCGSARSAPSSSAGTTTLDKGIPCPHWLAQNKRPHCAKTVWSNGNYVIHCSISNTVAAKKSCQNEVPVLSDNIKSHGQRWQRVTVQVNDGVRHINSYQQLLPFKKHLISNSSPDLSKGCLAEV